MEKNNDDFPSVMAFSRKLEVSDALMTSGVWDNIDKTDKWNPIKLHEKRNRATFSQFGAKDDDKSKPNLSWGDDATLPHDADTLKVIFTLKVLGNLHESTVCNEPEYEKKLVSKINTYRENPGFRELALRYAYNIVNARFLWRNRVGAESIKVKVKHENNTWNFNAYDYKLDEFLQPSSGSDFEKLVTVIKNGLQGDGFEYLDITAYSKLGFGQRVWPSQEMVLNIPKGERSRILFQLNDCAAIHSEKIGNALRTIDTWYGDNVFDRPIAVEPFGSVTSRGEARRKEKNDFYSLLGKWLTSNDVPENDQHYIIAILIRGGVFGGKK